MVGRNSPCPCGSGKKYKNCCLRAAVKFTASIPHAPHTRNIPQLDRRFLDEALQGIPVVFQEKAAQLNICLKRFSEMFVDFAPLSETTNLLNSPTDLNKQAHVLSVTANFLFGVRTTALLSDFVEALERRQLIAAALAGRSAIETAAAAVYLSSKVAEAAQGHDWAKVVDEIKRALFGSRFPWADVLASDEKFESTLASFSSGRAKGIEIDEKAVNVLTMIKYLDKRSPVAGMVQMVYENMSDFCHPAVGTAVAFLRTTPPVTTRVYPESGDRVTCLFWCMMGALVAPICEMGLLAMSEVVEAVHEAD
jgi:hypothetical protein